MAVTRADRAQDTSRITDLRDEYENRETQAEKKKSLEIKRNQKKHQDELKDVKQTYEDKISNLQEKYADKLNETEQKHQKQISDVRSLYLNQLKNKMEEANTEKKVLNDNYQMEAETQDKINESQKELLKKRFQEEIAKRDDNINSLHEKTRVGLQESVNTRSRKLQEAYNKELNTLKGNQEIERERFLKEKADSKDFYKSQISDLNKTKERQNTNWENKFSNAIEALGQQYSENDQVKQEIMQEELHRNKEKFDQKYEKLENRVLQANDTFRDSVDDRYNNQVRSRDAEINKLKNRMYVDQANLSKRKDLEKKNIIGEYEKRQANIEDMMDQQRESLKLVNNERIDKVINTNSKFNNELQKRTKIEQNLVNEKHRQDRAALTELHRNETFNIENSSEKRIDTIQKIANNKETKLVNYYDEYLDQMR
ncbi:MAG: hypothetical protein L6Q37_06765, partial [Bdellovibrionaceae bacterium]|nr:hypothetical protein [Pseudobdellovibrionaceae bacterium]